MASALSRMASCIIRPRTTKTVASNAIFLLFFPQNQLSIDLGKKAKDVLQKGFSSGHMLLFSHLTSTGASMSTTSIMTEGMMIGTVASSFKSGGVKADLSVSTLNQVTAETTYEDIAPGLKFSLTTTIPDASKLGKAEIVFQRDMVAIVTTMKGLKTKPNLECSANFGSERFSLGGSLIYDTESNVLSNMVAGLGYTEGLLSLALLYNPKTNRNVSLYCSREVNPNLCLAMHVNYEHDRRISESTIGGLYKLDPQTRIKAKVSNSGIASALLEYEPKPLVTIGLSAEINGKLLSSSKPKLGLNVTVLSV